MAEITTAFCPTCSTVFPWDDIVAHRATHETAEFFERRGIPHTLPPSVWYKAQVASGAIVPPAPDPAEAIARAEELAEALESA